MSDNPPFIDTQRIELLTELEHPRKHLHPAAFRSRRQGASGPMGGPTAEAGEDDGV